MTYSSIDLSTDDGVAVVTMNRPDRLNAITRRMLCELGDCFTALSARDDIRVAVLCGAGRAFAAGVDLRDLEISEDSLVQGNIGDGMNLPAQRLLAAIEGAPFPVIARVHGPCFTGALEIALACDWIVAAETARFGDTHARLGLRPTWGMSARLPEAVGLRRARELSFTGRTFSGVEAAEYGLAVASVPAERLDETVAGICDAIVQNSPGSLGAYKALYRGEARSARAQALEFEGGAVFSCPDAPARVEALLATIGRR